MKDKDLELEGLQDEELDPEDLQDEDFDFEEIEYNTRIELKKIINSIENNFRTFLFSFPLDEDSETIEAYDLDVSEILNKLETEFETDNTDEIISIIRYSDYYRVKLTYIDDYIKRLLKKTGDNDSKIDDLIKIFYFLDEIELFLDSHNNSDELRDLKEKAIADNQLIQNNLNSSNTLVNYLRHAQTHKIYVGEAEKFKKNAYKYECTFYFLIFLTFIYFSGLTIYVPDFEIMGFKIGFPAKSIANGNISFYIQKISVLVLSSTLAAFLLKRSFMNRELFQEAYRVAQELETLPSYIESFSKDVQEKVRLDLAYKYFGREYKSNQNSNENGSANFMAENIKANTEFLKALKDISTSKAEKVKNEADM